MYSHIDEAIGFSNGRVWVVFWRLVCNSHVGVGNMEGQSGKALNCGVAFVDMGA